MSTERARFYTIAVCVWIALLAAGLYGQGGIS